MLGRMLRFNVASLLRSAPGTSRDYPVALDHLPIAEDVEPAGPVSGSVRLSRTSRSILARGRFQAALVETCSRCLGPAAVPVDVEIDEEALPSIDIDTGLPVDMSAEPDALRIDEHHELDLAESLREAISLAEPIAPVCRQDCRGLCPECGSDLNADPAHAHPAEVDPRLAVLAGLRDRLSDPTIPPDSSPDAEGPGMKE
jgi:uncharacterized protein